MVVKRPSLVRMKSSEKNRTQNKKCVSGVALELEGGSDHGKILLVKGCDYDVKGKWGLPKGKVEEGESLWTAAYRELYEETGLRVDKTRDISYSYEDMSNVAGYIHYKLPYFALGPVVMQKEEIVDYGFFSLKDIACMDVNLYTRRFLNWMKRQESTFAPQNKSGWWQEEEVRGLETILEIDGFEEKLS